MNSTQPQTFKTINSQYFINHIDSLIVQLTRTIAIEQGLKPDPDAKRITRNIIQDRVNVLLEKHELELIAELKNSSDNKIKELLKIMRLDNE